MIPTVPESFSFFFFTSLPIHSPGECNGNPLQYSCLENPMDGGVWWAAVHRVAKSRTRLRDFTFTFYFHALEKEMAIHSRVLAWRIPGTGEPGGLPSMGLHRVRHDWSDLAVAAAATRSPHNIQNNLLIVWARSNHNYWFWPLPIAHGARSQILTVAGMPSGSGPTDLSLRLISLFLLMSHVQPHSASFSFWNVHTFSLPLGFWLCKLSAWKYLHSPPHTLGGGDAGLVAKLCPTLCNPMDYSLPGSSLHGISQARILEWVGISFSRGCSWPRDWTSVSCIAGGFFTAEPSGKPPHTLGLRLNITSCDGSFDDLLFSKLAIYLFFS